MNKINGCDMIVQYECTRPTKCKYSNPKYITMSCACKYNDFGNCTNVNSHNEAMKEWYEIMNCEEDENA